jgi:hypothetical protein
MTNFGSFVVGTGNGRTLELTSTTSGLLSGMRAAWLEAMMRISFRQKRNSTPTLAARKEALGLVDYVITA